MAEVITGDTTKGIKSIGELALRISKFDSYRLFTLYENVRERKVMDVSGNQKYYLVFKSPKKEIRIPEYEPNGFFEVDKVNGCILFKITKKNAEDILSMKTAGEKIFHIVRVFEETDDFGKVLNVTDEVEVYNGKWGDDYDFSTYSTENKVDLLTKALATQIDKNAKLMTDYNDLLEMHNAEVTKSGDLEKELEVMRAERDDLQTKLNEYTGNTVEGTLLSTDTKYIAFENTLDNISFTEEQYSAAMSDLMSKGEIDVSNLDINDPTITLDVRVPNDLDDLTINVYNNKNIAIGGATCDSVFHKTIDIENGDVFRFECVGTMETTKTRYLYLECESGIVNINTSDSKVAINKVTLTRRPSVKGTISYEIDVDTGDYIEVYGNIGTLKCYIE